LNATVFTPDTSTDLVDFVRSNAQQDLRTLCPAGGRTSLRTGGSVPDADVCLALTSLNRVIDYPARDMTITVEAGIGIETLTRVLAAEGQRLPIDIAQSSQATLGGALACNTSGPRRFGHGTFRDYVIGISAVDADGRLFKAGGRVVKNVAGYDLCKLLVGSRGTLAIITQVTLKLRPATAATELLWMPLGSWNDIEERLQRLLISETRPMAVEVVNPVAADQLNPTGAISSAKPVLCVGLEGTPREVAWQRETLQRELTLPAGSLHALAGPQADELWKALTEFCVPTPGMATLVANLRPSRCLDFVSCATDLGLMVQAHAASGIVIAKSSESAGVAPLQTLQEQARELGGNCRIDQAPLEWNPQLAVCGHPEPAWRLMRQLKQALDPRNLLNRGQFLDGVPHSL